jgi:hypothetical protein
VSQHTESNTEMLTLSPTLALALTLTLPL